MRQYRELGHRKLTALTAVAGIQARVRCIAVEILSNSRDRDQAILLSQ